MKAEELKAKYMDSKMVNTFDIFDIFFDFGSCLNFDDNFICIFLKQKPETEYTKQGYLFLMEKSKLSKWFN